MNLEIVNRRAVLKDFNERNCTTSLHSSYVGVRVVDNGTRQARLVFRHFNGVGRATFVPDEGVNHLRGLRINESYLG